LVVQVVEGSPLLVGTICGGEDKVLVRMEPKCCARGAIKEAFRQGRMVRLLLLVLYWRGSADRDKVAWNRLGNAGRRWRGCWGVQDAEGRGCVDRLEVFSEETKGGAWSGLERRRETQGGVDKSGGVGSRHLSVGWSIQE
jgi:hypothetical protein